MEEQRGIDIFNFVSKHLGDHKIRGKEIKVKTCPFCGRKEKFSINYEKGFYHLLPFCTCSTVLQYKANFDHLL